MVTPTPPATPTAPARLEPDELDRVVRFVAGQQARSNRRIAYVGIDPSGIRAELEGLPPPWVTTLRVRRDRAGYRSWLPSHPDARPP
ncbi:MAG TPA: hypothetical protein VIL36_21970 [Acidimicrobiales bacterium]